MSQPFPAEPTDQDVPAEAAIPEDSGATQDAVPAGEEGSTGPSGPRWKRSAVEWGVILGVAVLAAVVIRIWLIQPFYIPSPSMSPTLEDHDRVLVNKLSYDLHPVHRGDVVVFAKPPNDTETGIKDLVKRVIGLPGETIWSGPDAEIFINGKLINQPWLTPEAKADPGPWVQRMVIPAGEYFVMGDNRGNSSDSRVFGPIARKLIVGRAFVIVWPLSRFGGL